MREKGVEPTHADVNHFIFMAKSVIDDLEIVDQQRLTCEVSIDLTKLEHIPQESCYNNNWYKSEKAYFFVHCMEEFNQVDIYFSETLKGSKTFLISAEWNEDDVYSGELGNQWT